MSEQKPTKAAMITDNIIDILGQRKGFNTWFDNIEDEYQKEIKSEIEIIIALSRETGKILEVLKNARMSLRRLEYLDIREKFNKLDFTNANILANERVKYIDDLITQLEAEG